jgi:3-phenylpropionate/cinnamic acid dioxygenase small subunit
MTLKLDDSVIVPASVLTAGLGPADPELSWRASLHLAAEARALEERRFDDWLAMFDDPCLHWVPTHPEDLPHQRVSVSFEDHRRLTDRVVWLKSAHLHAQSPPSRTVRQVSNVEAWAVDGLVVVQSVLDLHEIRNDTRRSWVARVEHHLTDHGPGGSWLIRRKTVLLLDHDKPLGNIAFAF